jgi:hypothetical protein
VPLKLTIRFTCPDTPDLVNRIRNFAEDLERALATENAGRVENIDSAVTFVAVTIASRRKLGRALAFAKKTLRQHNFFRRSRSPTLAQHPSILRCPSVYLAQGAPEAAPGL